MPPKQKQKQRQSQNVRVTVNLAEKAKPRKRRGRYRRMKEPKEDTSRLAAAQAPRVQVIRYEVPMSQAQPQAVQMPLSQRIGSLREPSEMGAPAAGNLNAFGTRDAGAPMPDSSASAVVDTPSELQGVERAQFEEKEVEAPYGYFKSGPRKGQPRPTPTPVRRPRPNIAYEPDIENTPTFELMPQGRAARPTEDDMSLFEQVTKKAGMKRA